MPGDLAQRLETSLAARAIAAWYETRENGDERPTHERAEEFFRMKRFHDFEMASITGEPVEFSGYRDQACLIVNVASE